MRKFLPRLIHIITVILALFLVIPWDPLANLINSVITKFPFLTFLGFLVTFFQTFKAIKVFYIPVFLVLLSLIFLIVSITDRNRSVERRASKPIQNMAFAPLYYLGIASTLGGALYYFFQRSNFVFLDTDYFGLGVFINSLVGAQPFVWYYGLVIYGVLLILQILFASICFHNINDRGFFPKLIVWLLYLIFAVLSYKALTDQFGNITTIKDLILLVNPVEKTISAMHSLILLGLSAVGFVLFIVLGIIRAHKNNVEMKELLDTKPVEEEKKILSEEEQKQLQAIEQTEQEKELEKPLYELPKAEDVIETEVEEKTVIKRVVYEQSNLDEIYHTEFGFKNCSMVRRDDNTVDYFVNKVKFLTLSNNNKSMSFRLELDKAIRLIIQYPLIGKDKYEDHKIWFKIDDSSVLVNEVVASIVKDAYNAVLNND